MGVRWQSETSPDPQLLVLNESVAAGLGLDAAWLRSDDGLRFLVGNLLPIGRFRWRRPMPGINSAALSRGWATGGHCCSVSCPTSTDAFATYTSRAPARLRSPAVAMASRR